MELNSMLRNMGLIDAFSTTLNQVEVEQAPSECDYSCHDGCSGGCSGSNKA